ncbi:MAG: cobyric acid synthase [Rhizomicrobium sp.]
MTYTLMIQGTGSDVGKSLLVAGLARALTRRGMKVRPFKPQNMSNNAAVTQDGGEIGRAQALQARACAIAPSVHMNPVLLKPQSEVGAQIIVQGRLYQSANAAAYQDLKSTLMAAVRESFAIIRHDADIVLIEGAGSPAEINLRANDIANMGFARSFAVPVILVGDIDRGGVIASVVGTHAVLDPADRAMIRGFVINKFRGDMGLFAGGMREIEARTAWPGFGILPFVRGLALPAEDAIEAKSTDGEADRRVRIAVPILSRIANADEFDPLQLEPGVEFSFVPPGTPLPRQCDLIILPGSKATIADLRFLKAQGWHIDIQSHVRHGGRLLGICGGYQMLGRVVRDPSGVEGPPDEEEGLGLLDFDTVMTGEKILRQVSGICLVTDSEFGGYEMHVGRSAGPASARAMLQLGDGSRDGAVSPDGLVAGCYVHGLFAGDAMRTAWLRWLGSTGSLMSYELRVESSLDALASAIEKYLDVDGLLAIAERCRP